MRSKRIMFILIAFILVVLGVDKITSLIKIDSNILYDAYIEYDLSKQYNDNTYVEKQKQYEEEIIKLEDKLIKISEETEKAKKEQSEKIESNYETVETSKKVSGQKLYDLTVVAAKDNGTSVERFYTFNEEDIYTIQIKGLLSDLDMTLVDLQKSVENNNASIGNISIRQDYDAYNLGRGFDDISMLGWYNNKIVNAMGEVIDLTELKTEKESESDGDVDYTLMNLEDVKLDTESINREVVASNKRIDGEIAELVIEYGKQVDIIAKSDYLPEVKVELRESIDKQHEEAKQSLLDKKDIKKAEIEDKYNKIYEKEKVKVADAIFNYNKKLSEIKATLADSSQLDYTMTITLRVR